MAGHPSPDLPGIDDPYFIFDDPAGGIGSSPPGSTPPPGPGGGPGNFFGGRAQSLMAPVPGGYSPYGYRRSRLRPFGSPRMASPTMGQQGGYGPQGGQFGGFQSPGGAGIGAFSPGGSYASQAQPGGRNPALPAFDPNNPFAGSYPNQLQTTEDIMGYLLRQYAQGGGFDPMGDPRITARLRERAIGDTNAQQHAARVGLIGRSDVDPSTFGFQSLMGDLNSQGNVARMTGDAELQQALAMQQFYQNLFGQSALGTQNAQAAREQAAHQGRIQRGLQGGGFDWGGFAGGAGKLAGAFF